MSPTACPEPAARLGRAALQNHLLQLQDALVDVEGVRHDDGVNAYDEPGGSGDHRSRPHSPKPLLRELSPQLFTFIHRSI